MNHDVFISYSRKDTDMADRICAAFDKVGISYFIDRKGITGGMEFPQVLADAILQCRLFLFLASANSYQSKFTNNEVLYAFNKKTHNTLLPYIIDGSQLPTSLEFTFASINVRTIKEHPIEPVLVDDVLRLLGREEEDSVHRQAAQEVDARQAERKVKEEVETGNIDINYSLNATAVASKVEYEHMTEEEYLKKGYILVGKGVEVLTSDNLWLGIDDDVFDGRESLLIKIATSVKEIGSGAFEDTGIDSVVIPDCVTKIGDFAFKNCNLKSVVIPNSVTEIGEGAFENSCLQSIVIPGSVKSIGDCAFNECNNLESVVISEGVESIGEEAFAHCDLQSIVIPSSVKAIGNHAFFFCPFDSVIISDGVESIGENAFWGIYGPDAYVEIPKSVKTIGDEAFPDNVKIITK